MINITSICYLIIACNNHILYINTHTHICICFHKYIDILTGSHLDTIVSLYSWGINVKTPSACLKPQIVLNPRYATFS